VDGFFSDSSRAATRRFVEAYQEAYKDQSRPPGLLEATGYDSAKMFRKVLEETPAPLDRESFRDRLASLKNFEGATGKASFNERREAEKPLVLLGIENQEIRELAPNQTPSGS
jgi:ABC-type branched-subunit amino acid transport system substrate-binding protein